MQLRETTSVQDCIAKTSSHPLPELREYNGLQNALSSVLWPCTRHLRIHVWFPRPRHKHCNTSSPEVSVVSFNTLMDITLRIVYCWCGLEGQISWCLRRIAWLAWASKWLASISSLWVSVPRKPKNSKWPTGGRTARGCLTGCILVTASRCCALDYRRADHVFQKFCDANERLCDTSLQVRWGTCSHSAGSKCKPWL